MIPPEVERRARWVLDTLGGGQLGLGDDVPYVEPAWEQVERGECPDGDDLAAAFYHLARLEELDDGDGRSPRDQHGRFPASATCLDPDDPPARASPAKARDRAAPLAGSELRRLPHPRRRHSVALDADRRARRGRPAA